MELLKTYFKVQKQLYEYFGYVEDWVVIPIEDQTSMFWRLDGEGVGGEVQYCEDESFDEEKLYSSVIYTQRFLPKWVYRGKDYTMICTDPGVDGNHFLSIFTNSKERKYV